MKKKLLIEIISLFFIVLFVYAGLSKLLDYQKFRVEIGKSPLLTAYAGSIAWIIPVIEIITAGILGFTRFRLIGLYASFALMVMFTSYIIAILQFSDYIPCSCGGILSNMTWNSHLKFNIVVSLCALLGIILESSSIKKNITGLSNRELQHS